MKKVLFYSLLFVFGLCRCAAADYAWEFAGWYGGGCYPNVELDPRNKDRVYLTSDVAGVWRSDDRGEHWSFITAGLGHLLVPQVVIAPSDSNILYASTGKGVYLSTNAGQSWTPAGQEKDLVFSRPDNYRSLAVSPHNPQQICGGTARGEIYCSMNAGQTWTNLDPRRTIFKDAKPIPVLLYNRDAQELLIGASEGFFKYNFLTKAFQTFKDSPRKFSDMHLAWDDQTILAAADGKFWSSMDGGHRWSLTAGQHPGQIFRIVRQDLESDKERYRVYALWNQGWKSGVIFSDDKGASWQNPKVEMRADLQADPTRSWAQKDTRAGALKLDPFDHNVLFRADSWGVWRSDDAGLTWQEKIVGAPNTVGSDLVFTPDGQLYVATMDNGLLRSSDGGKTYEPLFPRDRYRDEENGHVWRVAVFENRIVATSSPWGKKINQVLISDDLGKTFRRVQRGLPPERPQKNTMWGQGYPKALAMDPQNPQTLYLGIDGDDGGGLFVSRDGGESWNRSQGQPGSLRVYHGLAVDPRNSDLLVWGASGNRGGVYISTDRGQTFRHALKEMSWVFNVAVADDGKIYAAGDYSGPALFVAEAADKPFRLLKKFTDGVGQALDAMAFNPHDPKMIVVSTAHWGNKSPCKIYLTRNAGKTWEDITGDLPPGAGAASLKFTPDGKKLYLSRYTGSVYRLSL